MNPKLIRLAYGLLGLMTLACFGGPFLLGAILRGGDGPGWPPDRPIEWAAFAGLTAVVVGVFAGLGAIWLVNLRQLQALRDDARAARRARPDAGPDRGGP